MKSECRLIFKEFPSTDGIGVRCDGGYEIYRELLFPEPLVNMVSALRTPGEGKISKDGVFVGRVYYSYMPDDSLFVEWLEFVPSERGYGYARKVLEKLLYKSCGQTISFEAREEWFGLYEHLGAEVTGYDDFREMYSLSLNLDDYIVAQLSPAQLRIAYEQKEREYVGLDFQCRIKELGAYSVAGCIPEMVDFYLRKHDSSISNWDQIDCIIKDFMEKKE